MSRTPEEDNPYISEDNEMYETRPHSSTKRYRQPVDRGSIRNTQPEALPMIQRASRRKKTKHGSKPEMPLSTQQPARYLKEGGGCPSTKYA